MLSMKCWMFSLIGIILLLKKFIKSVQVRALGMQGFNRMMILTQPGYSAEKDPRLIHWSYPIRNLLIFAVCLCIVFLPCPIYIIL